MYFVDSEFIMLVLSKLWGQKVQGSLYGGAFLTQLLSELFF